MKHILLLLTDKLVVEHADESLIDGLQLNAYFTQSKRVEKLIFVNGLYSLPLVSWPKEALHEILHSLTKFLTVLVLVLNTLQDLPDNYLIVLLEQTIRIGMVNHKVMDNSDCPNIHLERIGRLEILGRHKTVRTYYL